MAGIWALKLRLGQSCNREDDAVEPLFYSLLLLSPLFPTEAFLERLVARFVQMHLL